MSMTSSRLYLSTAYSVPALQYMQYIEDTGKDRGKGNYGDTMFKRFLLVNNESNI